MDHFSRRVCLLMAGVGAFLGSAYAAKECIEGLLSLPDVDANGMIVDNTDPENDPCRFCVNTNNGKASLKCTGTIENESGENQKYKNSEFFSGDGVTRSLYRVKAGGSAKLVLKGTFEL